MSLVLLLALPGLAADYTCDGYDDLAVGVVGDDAGAGGVQILHGGTGGITTVDTWRSGNHAMIGGAERFGQTIASADLDGDGCDELAVGSEPYGTANGLFVRHYVPPNPFGGEWWDVYSVELFAPTASSIEILSVVGARLQGASAPAGFVVDFRQYAWDAVSSWEDLAYVPGDGTGTLRAPSTFPLAATDAAAVGDLDGDGADDLLGGDWHGGFAQVYFGGDPLQTDVGLAFTQEDVGLESTEPADQFGAAVASGDFDGDGFADFVIGNPEEVWAGAVTVVPGSAAGPDLGAASMFRPGVGGVAGNALFGDQFGASLVTGDFNGDGYDDLAVGDPTSDFFATDAGAVHVLYGSSGGLSTLTNQIWGQNTSLVEGASASGDEFGAALAAGDWNGDGYDDLAVGVPGETVDCGNLADAGAVNVLYGTANRLSAVGDRLLTQNSAGIDDSCEVGDRFGAVLH